VEGVWVVGRLSVLGGRRQFELAFEGEGRGREDDQVSSRRVLERFHSVLAKDLDGVVTMRTVVLARGCRVLP
jgi:hypothetical protein